MTSPRLVMKFNPALRNGYALTDGEREVSVTDREGALLLALLFNREIDIEEAMEILWPDPDDMPDTWQDVIRVNVSHLSRKLAHFGFKACRRSGVYRWGWHLEALPSPAH